MRLPPPPELVLTSSEHKPTYLWFPCCIFVVPATSLVCGGVSESLSCVTDTWLERSWHQASVDVEAKLDVIGIVSPGCECYTCVTCSTCLTRAQQTKNRAQDLRPVKDACVNQMPLVCNDVTISMSKLSQESPLWYQSRASNKTSQNVCTAEEALISQTCP